MSTLEKPTSPQIETGQMPADQAGIFLTKVFNLGPGAEPPLTELVPIVTALDRAGRLVAQFVISGQLIIHALPNEEGEF